MPSSAAVGTSTRPPKWIKPQLTRLVDEAPAGGGWVHEIKYDGYRMHARIDGRDIKLLRHTPTDSQHRTGAGWAQGIASNTPACDRLMTNCKGGQGNV